MNEDDAGGVKSAYRTSGSMRGQLLQSEAEWAARNEALRGCMAELINDNAAPKAADGIEIGCQHGALTDEMSRLTRIPTWTGIDPVLADQLVTTDGCVLHPGRASALHFADNTFDVALFANVFEHVPPDERDQSLQEIYRVLKPGGIVVGQIPNPYFPIESHSRLPFMGWLPTSWQLRYWKLAPVSWEHDFYVVTMKHLTRSARTAGFDVAVVRNFNYPPEVIPRRVRWLARALQRPMRRMPWAWQFVLVRPDGSDR